MRTDFCGEWKMFQRHFRLFFKPWHAAVILGRSLAAPSATNSPICLSIMLSYFNREINRRRRQRQRQRQRRRQRRGQRQRRCKWLQVSVSIRVTTRANKSVSEGGRGGVGRGREGVQEGFLLFILLV